MININLIRNLNNYGCGITYTSQTQEVDSLDTHILTHHKT